MRMLFVNLHCILEISERYLVQLYCQTIEIDICFIPTFFGNKNNVGQDDIVAFRVFAIAKLRERSPLALSFLLILKCSFDVTFCKQHILLVFMTTGCFEIKFVKNMYYKLCTNKT